MAVKVPGALLIRGIAGAAIGALLGIILNLIDVWSLSRVAACDASDTCPTADPYADLGYAAEGIGAGVLVTIAICWIGFALADIRPLTVSVPTGIFLAMLTARVYTQLYTSSGSWHINQPELGPGWVVTLVYAGVFATLALSATQFRRSILWSR